MKTRDFVCALLVVPAVSFYCGGALAATRDAPPESDVQPAPAAAPATPPPAVAAETPAPAPAVEEAPAAHAKGDPWEKLNRSLYHIHDGIDHAVLRPVSLGYVKITPRFMRSGLHNAFSNLHEPVVFANDTLQLKPKRAGESLLRLVTNTTLGLGGFIDVASHVGLPKHDNDFGITLGRMKVGPGPYIFVPLFGPTTVRDLVGSGVDKFADPFLWYRPEGTAAVEAGAGVLEGLNTRASVDGELEAMKATSLDPYATIKSVYLQQRETEIHGGAGQFDTLPDFDDPAPAAAAPSPATAPETPSPVSPAPAAP